MVEKKKRNEKGHFVAGPSSVKTDDTADDAEDAEHPCCRKARELKELLKLTPTYLPPDTLKKVKAVLEDK